MPLECNWAEVLYRLRPLDQGRFKLSEKDHVEHLTGCVSAAPSKALKARRTAVINVARKLKQHLEQRCRRCRVLLSARAPCDAKKRHGRLGLAQDYMDLASVGTDRNRRHRNGRHDGGRKCEQSSVNSAQCKRAQNERVARSPRHRHVGARSGRPPAISAAGPLSCMGGAVAHGL